MLWFRSIFISTISLQWAKLEFRRKKNESKCKWVICFELEPIQNWCWSTFRLSCIARHIKIYEHMLYNHIASPSLAMSSDLNFNVRIFRATQSNSIISPSRVMNHLWNVSTQLIDFVFSFFFLSLSRIYETFPIFRDKKLSFP